MNIKNIFYTAALVFAFGASSLTFAADKIDAADFIDEVSAKNIAEVESAILAIEKSTSTTIKSFAQKMISEHSATNIELAGIAHRKNLKVADDAELMAKAKQFILKQRDGQSFDEAYASNQVELHKTLIELFQRAAISEDQTIAVFAKQTLPRLQEHLTEAKALETAHDKK
jgi:putative membrane protein